MGMIFSCRRLVLLAVASALPGSAMPAAHAGEAAITAEDRAFFTVRVLPILQSRCFECHSHDHEITGGLALDVASGW